MCIEIVFVRHVACASLAIPLTSTKSKECLKRSCGSTKVH